MVSPNDALAAQDEVDRIVAAWDRERPDLDPGPLHVFSRISRLSRRLDLDRRRAFIGHGLEGWEFDVLSALRRAGKPYQLTPTQLVRQTLVTSGTMTHRIARLAERGLVERSTSPTDARSVQIRLTDAGREVVDGAMAELIHGERQILASLGPTEQERLAALLKTLLEPFDEA